MFYDQDLIKQKLRKWESYLIDFTLPAWDELPRIELYMDQVISLLAEYLSFLPPEEGADTVATAAAINNYVRKKIMPAPCKKKYSRVHLAYLIMICSLKQSVSIAYVQKMIPVGISEELVHQIYDNYVAQHKKVSMYFVRQVHAAATEILSRDSVPDYAVSQLVSSAAVVAGLSKLMTEKIVMLQKEDAFLPESGGDQDADAD